MIRGQGQVHCLAIQNLDLLKKMNLNFAISLNNRNEISYFAF